MGGESEVLGTFEEQVLLAIHHSGRRAYGMTVRREIERRTSRSVSIGAVYSTMNRLEKKGLIESYHDEPDPSRDGRARRFLRLLPDGIRALARTHEVRMKMWEGLDPAILSGGEGS